MTHLFTHLVSRCWPTLLPSSYWTLTYLPSCSQQSSGLRKEQYWTSWILTPLRHQTLSWTPLPQYHCSPFSQFKKCAMHNIFVAYLKSAFYSATWPTSFFFFAFTYDFSLRFLQWLLYSLLLTSDFFSLWLFRSIVTIVGIKAKYNLRCFKLRCVAYCPRPFQVLLMTEKQRLW